MEKVYFLRHAESTFNASSQKLDELNCGLSSTGEAQARALQGQFDVIVISPLRRCRETLELSNIQATQIIVYDDAREMRTDLCDFFPGEQIVIETEEEILQRCSRLKQELVTLSQTKKVLVIAHYWILWYMTSKVIEGERFGLKMNNGEIVDYDF